MATSSAQRAARLIGLFALAALAAAAFGALHNQISYSVGPDYFHALKFDQFQVADWARNRFGAALVGVGASWWMGPLLAAPALLLALAARPRPASTARLQSAFAVALVTAIGCATLGAVAGLLFAVLVPPNDPGLISERYRAVEDAIGFRRAAWMHLGAYLGGAIGALLGAALFALRRKPLSFLLKNG